MNNKVYIQLYSILKTRQEDLLSALHDISKIGYDGVELMGTYTGGLTPRGLKGLLTTLKLDPISSHGLKDEKDFSFAAELGIRYTDVRTHFETQTRDEVLRACDQLNEDGKLRAKFGIKAVLHNHSQEFRWVSGEENKTRIYDLLLQNTDPELVNFEFDVGWGAFAGVNPVDYILKYPGRFPLIHVKEVDRVARNDDELEHFPKDVIALGKPVIPLHPDAATTGIERSISYFSAEQARIMYQSRKWNCRLGRGIIDWHGLKNACEAQGIQGYISEREYCGYDGGFDDPVMCAAHDYEFLREL
ncbi:sugar phosphate isomerase/epimerase family protein [Klebsiella pneumoniae]|uniref:sugar phosphate isomerase/epimerase family protein n=1 Tax=Klebsiella pneumoniae TaxID=573 RepID=UPI001ABC7195|nr:sugar phosphate isomerase/epimerase [Klebsiella pneumoniae]MBO3721285.1 sugar phosphate isomerase/epimerase [Klebsiella pneumoniae]HCM5830593.1 sugar phosphate isomerase/epimerase [Klebsiella pneumoniae]